MTRSTVISGIGTALCQSDSKDGYLAIGTDQNIVAEADTDIRLAPHASDRSVEPEIGLNDVAGAASFLIGDNPRPGAVLASRSESALRFGVT